MVYNGYHPELSLQNPSQLGPPGPQNKRNGRNEKKKTWKQALALVLALVMALSLVALPSFAEGEEDSAGLPNGVSIVSSGGSTEGTVGMEMSKTLQLNADGKTGTLTLEAYATGNSQVLQKEVPLDIVLVLDQSGSMAYKFNGQGLGWGDDDTDRRQYAMKNAVKNFINSVADKYDPETSDHRMAVVTFGSSASTLVNWTQVDGTGKSTLTTAIDRLPSAPNGGTQTGQGMQQAQTLLDNSKYTGSNQAQRTQVVIMFTDGVPGDSGFDISVANDAIKAAKTMKDNGVVVYTIGIFTGAEPSQLYGGSGNGSVGDYWSSETASANRFMNYVSSNFKAAADLGLEDYYYGYYHRITKNYTRDSSNYYLAASDADGLNNVFSTISSTIGGSDSTLTATATMVDVISEYFQLPKNYLDSLKAYTVPFTGTDASGNRQWGANQTRYTPSVEDDKVSVTGFNYSDNWVGFHTDKDGKQTARGSKMVLEIPIQVKDGTVGEVPTNDLNNSGILDGNGDMFAKFVSPVVKYAYFTVVPVTSSVDENGKNYGTRGQEKKVRLLDNPTYNLVNEVPKDFLYGGTFNEETCTTVHNKVKGQNPMAIAPVENETYYIWEVPDTYLRPFTFYVWQHVDGKETVTKLYPLVGVDRTNYADVGFAVCWGKTYNETTAEDVHSGCGELTDSASVGTKATVYQRLLAVKAGAPVESWYLMKGAATMYPGDIKATNTVIDEGCIGGFRLDARQFENFKTAGITYRPYWITLDGVRVDSVRSRTLTFQEGSKTPIYNPSQTGKYSAGYTYVNPPTAQTLSFRTCMLADDSQPVVDERLTVTVVDGSNTTQVKVAPNGSVRDQVAYQAPAGKVFAGWFADQAYTTPADLDQVTEDTTIYAKYVSDSYLDLDYSRTGLFRLRGVTLISAVDNPANYQASGIMVNGQKLDVSYASRYRIFKTPANLFGAARDAKLMLADKSLSGTGDLEVTPYWITLDGTEVHGVTHTLHYNTRTIWE